MNYARFLSDQINIPELSNIKEGGFSHLNHHIEAKNFINKSEKQKFYEISAQYLGIPLLLSFQKDISEELLSPLSFQMCKANQFLPLEISDGETIIALSSPEKSMAYADDYARLTEREVSLVYMPEKELMELIHKAWDQQTVKASEMVDGMAESEEDLQSMANAIGEPEDLLDADHDAPVIKLINSVLSQAMKEKASDIHIEPFEKNIKVRFRVDGVMHTVVEPSRKLHDAMSARLKVMASLDIAEKRLPQDGRFKIRLAGKDTDIRISTLPTQHGERIVLRLLGQQEGVRSITEVGLRPEQVDIIKNFFKLPNGMIFICGPTGSGKTSTLYAGLKEINTPDKNIVTVEDPVEYEMEGLGQIPVNKKIGMTFAAGLRSILRQDPDVVVVGETRDLETAEIAVESSLTGHLVLSTVHTNDAPSTVTRLMEMGIEPFLVASSLRGVIAQRMIRKLNPVTKKPRKLDADTKKIFEDLPENVRPKHITLYDAVPSDDCPSGYKGRSGIFEVLTVTDGIRHLINNKASDAEIGAQAGSEGMLTLYQEGLLRAAKGETTLEEVIRVTKTQG